MAAPKSFMGVRLVMSRPISVSREAFGSWLSGFVDGEGSFILRCITTAKKNPHPCAEFKIALRDDDSDILEAIKEFFGCGGLTRYSNARSAVANAKPVMVYSVTDRDSNAEVIVPHFEKYPLLAKKRADFAIWREAVLFLKAVKEDPMIRLGGQRGGFGRRWSEERLAAFNTYRQQLRDCRCYETAEVIKR